MEASQLKQRIRHLRYETFSTPWPLDEEIAAAAAGQPSHSFLRNPASQLVYVYLTRFVRAASEAALQRPFSSLSVLDWGCGKGHVSKLMRDLAPRSVESCDIVSKNEDSAFGQTTPILEKFGIAVTPLLHESQLPYASATFDVALSVGVLEHVPNDRASLAEIARVLKPGGVFFCFNLPAELSWTQKISHCRGDFYHDRLYSEKVVRAMLPPADLEPIDVWYRQILPKNTVRYPFFRSVEKVDQLITFHTPLRFFATSVEFVSIKRGKRQDGDAPSGDPPK
ncbi:MAG: class I SAM-dependent methyltransferase [Acidobacteriota bacterium]